MFRAVCTDRRQVFGLVGALALAGYFPNRRRFPTRERVSAYDGFRSYLPLRGSPGFAPGSLFRRFETKRTDRCVSTYSSEIFLSTLNVAFVV